MLEDRNDVIQINFLNSWMGFFSAEVEIALSIKEHERKKAYLLFLFFAKCKFGDLWNDDPGS